MEKGAVFTCISFISFGKVNVYNMASASGKGVTYMWFIRWCPWFKRLAPGADAAAGEHDLK